MNQWPVLTIACMALSLFVLDGCATFVCHPATVTVANKRETARFETVPGAVRTTELGRLEEDPSQSRTVRDYWVQQVDGKWYRVSADKFRAAEIGRTLEVCE